MNEIIKHFYVMVLICIVAALQIPTALHAQTATAPSVGDGSDINPYQIVTIENLCWMSQNYKQWNKVFVMTSDIDATQTSRWYNGGGFVPIGDGAINFSGIFHGHGHVIKNLFINRSGTDYVGLFGDGQVGLLTAWECREDLFLDKFVSVVLWE
jgi:hypothetical protein